MNADGAWHRKEAFQEVMHREAVRSSRSGRSFLLLLFDVSVWGLTEMTRKIISVLSSSTREIDVKGWYTDGAIIGILFTELGRMHNSVDAAREAILGRLYGSLSGILSNEEMLRMDITPYPPSREVVGLDFEAPLKVHVKPTSPWPSQSLPGEWDLHQSTRQKGLIDGSTNRQ